MLASIWLNPFFYLFLVILVMLVGFGYYHLTKLNKKNSETKLLQQQYAARIDVLRKEHSDTMEKLRTEMLKREEDRSRQWIESERETLRVLNGVSSLLDLSKKMGRVDSDKIMKKLGEIQIKVENLKNLK
jgi:predicted membrane protein